MKRIALLLTAVITLSGCSSDVVVTKENIPSVEVETIGLETHSAQLNYVGIIKAETVKKYAFKSDGKLDSVNVKEGDRVKAGDMLAALEKADLELAAEAVQGKVQAAEAQYRVASNGARKEDLSSALSSYTQAKATYEFNLENHGKVKSLYAVGSVSKADYDGSKLQVDVAKEQMNQAQQQYNIAVDGARTEDKDAAAGQLQSAKAEYDLRVRMLEDADMHSESTGTVASVTVETGDMISAGYPAIVVQSDEKIVSVGMTQEDVQEILIGKAAEVRFEDFVYSGEVVKIQSVPDNYSRTYEVEIAIDGDFEDVLVGSLAKVLIDTDPMEGVWITINNLFNDGEDYVYVVEDGRAIKRNVEVVELLSEMVLVTGLEPGNQVITKGYKNIKLGHKVNTVEDGE